MTLEYLIEVLKTHQVTHPYAEVNVTLESSESGSQSFDIVNVRYDNLSKSAVIEI